MDAEDYQHAFTRYTIFAAAGGKRTTIRDFMARREPAAPIAGQSLVDQLDSIASAAGLNNKAEEAIQQAQKNNG